MLLNIVGAIKVVLFFALASNVTWWHGFWSPEIGVGASSPLMQLGLYYDREHTYPASCISTKKAGSSRNVAIP